MSELLSEVDIEGLTEAWVVFRLGGHAPSVTHSTKASAISEAERLARVHHDKFFVAQLLGSARRCEVQWTFVGDDVPF